MILLGGLNEAMMRKTLFVVGLNLLLAANSAAFQRPPPLAGFRADALTRPSTPKHDNERAAAIIDVSLMSLRSSQSDDNARGPGGDGYEIRSSPGKNGAPRTTFGAENVPVDQRPSNEYLDLINAPTFGWASQESGDGGLVLRLAAIYVAFYFLVCFPITGATWVEDGFLLQKVTASNVGAISVVFVMVLRLYSGWGYIGARLRDKDIEYEETGWFDGDVEPKSDAEKARDLFLYRSNVQPVEERLKKFALATGGAWVASCLALNLAVGSKPLFDQYDGQMLNALQYDDKVAELVQAKSNGKPTYCESRYYRAVANGGQGCN